MEENHPIEKLMVTAMNSIKDMIDANTIVGEPITALNNTVIIPISKVGFGFAAGGSEFTGETINYYNKKDKEENVRYRLPFGGGSGAGVNIIPIAFLVVQNDSVKLLEANHTSVLDKLVEYIPDAIEKVSSIVKEKIDNSDDEIDDEIDDDYEDIGAEYEDDDWLEDDEFEDKSTEKKNHISEKDDNSKGKKESGTREISKKEVNQIIDNEKGKTKKFEEKIKEIKKNNDK